MGGYGSTRWGTHRKKTTVEECKILPISLLIDGINCVIENDYEWRGNVSWSCEGEPRGEISCLVYLENEIPKLRHRRQIQITSAEPADCPLQRN